MEKSLSSHDVRLGIEIFIVELVKVAILRGIFIMYVMLLSLLVFPLVAGSVATLMIYTIPVIYMAFALPALLFGLCLALFMVLFRQHIQQGSSSYRFFAMFSAPLVVLFCFYVASPSGATNIFMFIERQMGSFYTYGWIVLIAILFYGSFIVGAGMLVSSLLKKDIIQSLLVAPTSVRRQLMAYKRKTGG